MKIWTGLVVVSLLGVAVGAGAQSKPASANGVISASVSYNAMHAGGGAGSSSFWTQGGGAEVAGTLADGFGAVANVTGLHTANAGHGVPVNLVAATFGPRYTWVPRRQSSRSVAIFAQGLVGEAHGFHGLFPAPGESITSASGLAVNLGGGVDLSIRRHLALRVIEASWLRTQLPNSGSNVQNNLLLGAGIVFRSR
ncbi:hypothetical protein GCM10011507_34130 [Edaphobacter acidisoli]|uniref:Outer membrane protein beta-barrel domain-containing protein n=1 Tax=Edaphobacter acidisoli TaxID=2040573 RepID=A0A916WAE0_9BACT|nr:hypothetical protein [Edaphobacter acidisoli]GGA80053.1 hypothetical protein GCM10011507_34130 [Edaphobacter acidisoli]